MKTNGEKISMVTAYDYPSAKLAEQAGIDMLLVGDSLGMVMLGYSSTVEVTMEDMIHHGKAVARGAKDTFIAIDMPFMSYHVSIEKAMENAQRLIQQTHAHAVKMEGATEETLRLIRKLTEAGIPVVSHLGLTPQSVNTLGGYRVQGKDIKTAKQLMEDTLKVEEYGAFSVVLECVPEPLASYLSKQLTIPTIGIGAGNSCDGQVLVYHDILQYGTTFKPSFVKVFHETGEDILQALHAYHQEVKSGAFPDQSQSFQMDQQVIDELMLED